MTRDEFLPRVEAILEMLANGTMNARKAIAAIRANAERVRETEGAARALDAIERDREHSDRARRLEGIYQKEKKR